jgi:serine/threonine protein kinase
VTTEPTVVPLIERVRRATLGRFDVIATLGEGGMATVFLARDLALDRQVAIKVMKPSLMSSPAAIGRFRKEARVVAALDHPHIISIFAVGEDAELAFYVMRYVEGRALNHVITDDGALSFRRAESIIAAVGAALHYAHRRGVIHRDVKPANIMLDHDDWVIVTDFGIAKHDDGDRLTVSGHVFGTPHYMSPEYFNGGEIGPASDQYALGVVAFELLTGTMPFPGDTIGQVMRGHLFDPIPSLAETSRPRSASVSCGCSRRSRRSDT